MSTHLDLSELNRRWAPEEWGLSCPPGYWDGYIFRPSGPGSELVVTDKGALVVTDQGSRVVTDKGAPVASDAGSEAVSAEASAAGDVQDEVPPVPPVAAPVPFLRGYYAVLVVSLAVMLAVGVTAYVCSLPPLPAPLPTPQSAPLPTP